MKKLIAMSVFVVSVSVFGARAPWGPEELKTAGEAAFTAFESEFGEEAYSKITEYQVKMSGTKNSAKVYLTYTDENGEQQVQKFFCHTHGTEIDCH